MSNLTRHAIKYIFKSGSYLTGHIMPHFFCICNTIGEMRNKLANTPSSVKEMKISSFPFSLSLTLWLWNNVY